MIHDLDIVLAFVNSDVEVFDAVGVSVLSNSEDIANVESDLKTVVLQI
jgi:hypothetical protein